MSERTQVRDVSRRRGAARIRRSARLPNFIVIGAMKSGTTSLFRYLEPHPEVFMPRLKELDFFIVEWNWARGLDWYRRRFRQAVS